MIRTFLAVFLTLALFAAGTQITQAKDDPALTSSQEDAVKKLIHDYLLQHPETVMEAIQALQEKARLSLEMEAKKVLVDRKTEIFNDPNTPVLGNPKGDVTVVEFFDYRCPYCKAMSESLLETIKADGKVRLVMKELPVLGPDSVYAARAALAARDQSKFEAFHQALMRVSGPLNEAVVLKVAGDSGLNIDALKSAMTSDTIDKVIDANLQLAHDLDINGTPGFIVGDQIIPGAMSAEAMKQLIDTARKKS
jgi:protein-disulfide isomerase